MKKLIKNIKKSIFLTNLDEVRETLKYKDLLYFFVWRNIKLKYKQTLIGFAWVALRPLISIFVFALVFHNLKPMIKIDIPYLLFVYVGMMIWTFFADAIRLSTESMLADAELVKKVFFPKILIPLSLVFSLILDLAISVLILALIALFYGLFSVKFMVVTLLLLFIMIFFTMGICCIVAALNARYRDVRYIVPFLLQIGFFLCPIIYPVNILPQKIRFLLSYNPISYVMEGIRTMALAPVDLFGLLTVSMIALFSFLLGSIYFYKVQYYIVDEI